MIVNKMTVGERIGYYIENVPPELRQNDFVEFLTEKGYFQKPYAPIGFETLRGSLFEHNWNVSYVFRESLKMYSRSLSRPLSYYLLGLTYNLYLLDVIQMKDNHYILTQEYFEDSRTLGEKTIAMLSQFFDLTEEERFCIYWHRGTFDFKFDKYGYVDAMNQVPSVFTLNCAEVFVSHILDYVDWGDRFNK